MGASIDALLAFSLGGGNVEKQVSVNLIRAMEYAKRQGSAVLGILRRDGGFTKQVGDAVVVVPMVDDRLVTPHSEALQAVVWHYLVSHDSKNMLNEVVDRAPCSLS